MNFLKQESTRFWERVRLTKQANNNGANLGFEAQLWAAADKLRGNMEPSDYKHVALGLIFLKYISDAFEAKRAYLLTEELADAEDPEEYLAENVFWVPRQARWSHLRARAKQSTIGKDVDDAMLAIEANNASLKGVLPKDYARPALNKVMLGELIDLVSGIGMAEEAETAPETSSGGSMNISSAVSPEQRASGAESFIRPVPWSGSWLRCWSPTRAVSTTPAVAPEACLSSPKNSSRNTAGASATSLSTDRRATTRPGDSPR